MRDRASDLRAIADGRLMLNVRNGVTVSRSMLARIADEFEAMSTALAAKDAELAAVNAERDAAREYAMQARLCEKAAEDARVSAVSRASRTEAALAAKDAELGRKDMQLEASAKVALDLSAQLAEANKALEPLWMLADAVFRDGMNSGKPDDAGVWGFDNATLTYGHLRTARRIREQGGENG